MCSVPGAWRDRPSLRRCTRRMGRLLEISTGGQLPLGHLLEPVVRLAAGHHRAGGALVERRRSASRPTPAAAETAAGRR